MTENTKTRLQSLDTLRGFDMIWIIGIDVFFHALAESTNAEWVTWISEQMEHAPKGSFYFYDLIFPLFMLISGAAIPYALLAKQEKGVATTVLVKKVVIRGIILIVFGAIYNGMLTFDFANLRIASVLGQIGIGYVIAALIALYTRNTRQRIVALVSVLLGVTVLHLFIPVPGYGAGVLNIKGSMNAFIDQLITPGVLLYGGELDPEGALSCISASAVTLMGVLAGGVLRSELYAPVKKVKILFIAGIGSVLLAVALSPWYAIVKFLWTATYDLLAGGLSLILLAVFYLVIDVWQYKGWTFFFRVIGLNAITIYMGTRILNFEFTSEFIFGGIASWFDGFEKPVILIGVIVLEWLFLYFLYRRRIFLKI